MVRKLFILFCVGILVSPVYLLAGIYGSIKGQIFDAETDKPIPRASVLIEGTTLGAYAGSDGKFIVMSISPGDYNVRITAVGYAKHVISARVSIDEVTDLGKIKMDIEAKTTGTVVKTVERAVSTESIGTIQKLETGNLTANSRENISAIVGLSAGVFNTSNGFSVRGARTTETQIRVDGLDVGNQFTGGFGGLTGSTYYPMVSANATEEVQVLSGGFSAEYGDAMGGIVNTVVKTGKTDKYEGTLRWRTDVPSLFGSQSFGVQLVNDVNRLRPIITDNGAKLLGDNENKLEFTIGGPIPELGKSTFFLTGSYLHNQYRGAGYDLTDPLGTNIGHLPNEQTWVKDLEGRLKFSLIPDVSVIIGGKFGQTNLEYGSYGFMYDTDQGVIGYNNGQPIYNGVPEWKAKLPVSNTNITSLFMRITHNLTQNSFYELTLSNSSNNDEYSRRADYNDPGLISGFNLLLPQDSYVTGPSGEILVPKTTPLGDHILDQYTLTTSLGTKSKDGYLISAWPTVNNLTGYVEGASSTTSTTNAFGLQQIFSNHGSPNGVDYRKGNYYQLDGNYNITLLGDTASFGHAIKAGFQARYYTQRRHYDGQPWDGHPFFDVYSEEWGGNLYVDNLYQKDISSKPFHPYNLSAYFNDQIRYKGIIITPGLRFDYFNSNSLYRTDPVHYVELGADSGFAQSASKINVSPRINILYPITERSNFSINYGIYYKMPELQYLYDSFNSFQLKGNVILGDPNMNIQRTNEYQVQYNNSLTDIYNIAVTAYYRDVYNEVGTSYVPSVPNPYWIYSVYDYGNARGLEIVLSKMATMTDHIGITLNYNLSSAIGTSPSPGSNYGVLPDPYTGKLAFPLTEFPTSNDRRHRINLMFNLSWMDGQGPSIAEIYPLENSNINFSGFWQSGTPYTQTNSGGKAISEFNALRQPSFWQIDMRLEKRFYLKDWLGNSAGKTSIDFFVDVNNILNNRQAAYVNSVTSDPIDDGVTFYKQKGTLNGTTFYQNATFGITQSFSVDQYDIYGARLYNKITDFNHDGFVTIDEKYQSLINYYQLAVNQLGNYLAPRTVYFGMMFSF